MLEFTRRLLELRRTTPALRRTTFFEGRTNSKSGLQDVTWLAGNGTLLSHDEWHNPKRGFFGALLDGAAAVRKDDETRPLLLLFNQGDLPQPFLMPKGKRTRWTLRFDTSLTPSFMADGQHVCDGGATYYLRGHTMALFVLMEGTCQSRSFTTFDAGAP
jgi:glycogen operon protein